MKERRLYTCNICNTDYANKQRAIECENNHKLLEKATIVGQYKSIGQLPNGEPYRIRVKFPGTNDWIEYKR